MADVSTTGLTHEDELTDTQLDKISGGTNDFHFTKTVDVSSPTLFEGGGTSTPAPPPPPKKA